MALLFIDGFDTYGSATAMARGKWTGLSLGGTAFPAGRFGGRSCNIITGSLNLGANIQQSFLGFAWKPTSSGSRYITWYDTNQIQCRFEIVLSTGVVNAQVCTNANNYAFITIGSSLPGVIGLNAWAYIEASAKIHNTMGSMEFRVNEQAVLSVSGVNTRLVSINNSANRIYFDTTGYIDDLYLCDTTTGPGSRPMNGFLGDKRVATMFPASNVSSQWTPIASATKATPSGNYNASLTISANNAYVPVYSYGGVGEQRWDPCAIIAERDCTLNSITLRATANTANIHIRPLLYGEDMQFPENPGSLIATGDATTGLAAGDNIIPFGSTAPVLTKGAKYWLGFIADAGVTLQSHYNVGSAIGFWQYKSATYPNAPSTFEWQTSSKSAQASGNLLIDYTISATNYGNVMENDADGGLTYNSTDTLDNKDLFSIGPALSSSASVYAVQVMGSYRKDDANTRSVANLIKSGATETAGADLPLNADYKNISDVFAVDPNTSSNWTVANVNAAEIGYKVTA
jgi:hypothetical protein